jgi:hypothetical protein
LIVLDYNLVDGWYQSPVPSGGKKSSTLEFVTPRILTCHLNTTDLTTSTIFGRTFFSTLGPAFFELLPADTIVRCSEMHADSALQRHPDMYFQLTNEPAHRHHLDLSGGPGMLCQKCCSYYYRKTLFI